MDPRINASKTKEKHKSMVNAVTMRYLRDICGKTRIDRVSSESVLKECGLKGNPIDNVRCAPAAQNPSACFLFQLPIELEPDDLTTVELWIYKERDRLDQHNQTFVVSEVAHWDINHSTQKTKLLTIKDTDVKEGWVKIDMAWVVKNWLEYQELFHAIFIECKSCGMEVARSPISLQPDRKPFLIIRTSSVNKRRRSKRHVNCVPGVSECCRENLYISFAEIGWDDWILHPTGYQAYFCRGSCSNAASLTVSGSHYNSIIRKLLYQGRPNNKRIDLVPCCTATHLSSIQLLYMDNNQALTQKTLPNMVVDSCG
ncbi:unnamed protein product [Timema podura]|uniref:TGF-beta family profile domain-containing protein n=1 Tax=Timema podura TaxID=61482 RepID=A0ABN7NBL1_TIMPD|nr:unnamed protein product [Timema podura]